jgi:hypothetical protein
VKTTYRPISKRRLAELQGYVWWVITLFRAVLFIVAVGVVGWLLRAIQQRIAAPPLDSDAIWLVPTLGFAVAVYMRAGRWTGGRSLRAAVRADLAGGVAAVHEVNAVDAVEVEEQEDEGPSYFILTDDGTTLLFSGQYLAPYKRKGFPWKTFEILEAPSSKIFFGLMPRGEKLVPSVCRPPLTWAEFKEFARGRREYGVVDVDFAALKEGRLTSRAAQHG